MHPPEAMAACVELRGEKATEAHVGAVVLTAHVRSTSKFALGTPCEVEEVAKLGSLKSRQVGAACAVWEAMTEYVVIGRSAAKGAFYTI